uniref:Uncharacterized protein n=1 Tax=viral metagenome TaxID=1070528 RepID=A0A6C0D4F0_9ZZZZ
MFSNNAASLECAYPVIKETVPQSSLGYHANNKYDGFPPLMNDGRSITATWQPESTINADLIRSNDIQSNWQYRRYLTKNATEIMQYNFRESSNDIGYYKRPLDVLDIQSNLVSDMNHTPYTYNSILDSTKPIGYSTSDLKDTYLTREQLSARKISPVITQEQLLKMQ